MSVCIVHNQRGRPFRGRQSIRSMHICAFCSRTCLGRSLRACSAQQDLRGFVIGSCLSTGAACEDCATLPLHILRTYLRLLLQLAVRLAHEFYTLQVLQWGDSIRSTSLGGVFRLSIARSHILTTQTRKRCLASTTVPSCQQHLPCRSHAASCIPHLCPERTLRSRLRCETGGHSGRPTTGRPLTLSFTLSYPTHRQQVKT